jgi:hypothetical protein
MRNGSTLTVVPRLVKVGDIYMDEVWHFLIFVDVPAQSSSA